MAQVELTLHAETGTALDAIVMADGQPVARLAVHGAEIRPSITGFGHVELDLPLGRPGVQLASWDPDQPADTIKETT